MKKLSKRFFVLLYCGAFIVTVAVSHLTSRTVTAMIESSPVPDRTVIVIDAGHGGIDGGATAVNGTLESHINLQIAQYLNDICHLLGMETRMVRTTDTSIYTEGNTIAAQKVSDLKNRVSLVNDTENAILVSIHQNTFSSSMYSGPQVFHAKDENSRLLAQRMQSGMIASLDPRSNRKAKVSNGIYLLDNIRKPGILIECGFISNPEEAAKLCQKDYQILLSAVISTNLLCAIANT